ncbi:hypothetical protein LCGC14_1284050 [marine sediment metagenome]|uniref:Uncharacterized protein n=1 Tax=marine sediment metagenome TaxID=412755 RepID=A0A0F9NAZ5_9ZZZZ
MNTEALPKHMRRRYTTLRGFRCWKRAEARMASEILYELLRGCAYTPARQEISEAVQLIRTARRKMSVKSWGRGEME